MTPTTFTDFSLLAPVVLYFLSSEILDPLESFKTFNQFFYRKLKPSARPIDQDPDALVSVADCRLMCFDTVSDAQKLWIKGREFTIERLLGEKFGKEASKFSGGSVGIFRVSYFLPLL